MEKTVIYGRGAWPGKVSGEAIVFSESLQGWLGIDDLTGEIVEEGHSQKGKNISGKILILPYGKGSTGWSSHFHAAAVSGFRPAGWLFSKIDSRTGVGAAILGIPVVTDFPKEVDLFTLIKSGDHVEMDGSTGEVVITAKN
jgi:predicted aconitase with swiveling domain